MYETICMLQWFAGLDGSQILEIQQVFTYHALSREIQNTQYQSARLQGPVALWDVEIFLILFRPGIKSD